MTLRNGFELTSFGVERAVGSGVLLPRGAAQRRCKVEAAADKRRQLAGRPRPVSEHVQGPLTVPLQCVSLCGIDEVRCGKPLRQTNVGPGPHRGRQVLVGDRLRQVAPAMTSSSRLAEGSTTIAGVGAVAGGLRLAKHEGRNVLAEARTYSRRTDQATRSPVQRRSRLIAKHTRFRCDGDV